MCADSNPCTIETCRGGMCVYSPAPAGTLCRAARESGCDAAEVCDGASIRCPANAYAPAGQVCRAAAGECDAAELCSGATDECPPNVFATAGECRPAADTCDVPETCSGTSATCPPNVLRARGNVPCDSLWLPAPTATCL
jgi:hypothetical protein